MSRTLVYLIYNLLLPLALLLGFPSFLIKGIRRGGLARNFRQRFGFFQQETLESLSGKNPIWIHAVSVGEVFVALKIVEAIQAKDHKQPIVLSTTTTTGYAVAAEKSSPALTVIHNPVDLPWVCRRVIRLLDPVALVLIEAEIWPNLVAQLKRRGVPVQLINARLSPRSEKRYLKFLPLIEPVFSQLDAVTVPFKPDLKRWAALGIPIERITVLGSVKFDSAPSGSGADSKVDELRNWLLATGLPDDSRVLLGASTHDGEEVLLARIADQLRKEFPSLALVIVPRHAERAPEIVLQLNELGLDPVLRVESNRVESPTQQGSIDPEKRVWIANTTGELRAWFPLAEIVIVGKSFCSEGGQNPVEPILAGKPVIVGPNMQNFADVVADLNSAEGICQIADSEMLPEAVSEFFRDPDSGFAMAERGAAAMAQHSGASFRSADFILEAIKNAKSGESVAGQSSPSPSP